METSNALLDLLCFHGYNAEPEKVTESEETPENEVIEVSEIKTNLTKDKLDIVSLASNIWSLFRYHATKDLIFNNWKLDKNA